MSSVKCFSLTGLFVLLVAIANGCSQFPSVVPSDQFARSTAGGNPRSAAVVQFGEDPDAFESGIDPERRRSNLLITRARLAVEDGETDAALQLLQGILDEEPDHAEASHLLAVLKTQSGDLEAAEARFRTALKADAGNPELNSDYGYFCYLSGRWDDAERYLTRALETDPALARAHTNLGMLEARRGNPDAAGEHFRNAGCTEVEVLNNLALARFLEADFATAQSLYHDALELDPENRPAMDGLRMANHMSATIGAGTASSPVSLAVGTATLADP